MCSLAGRAGSTQPPPPHAGRRPRVSSQPLRSWGSVVRERDGCLLLLPSHGKVGLRQSLRKRTRLLSGVKGKESYLPFTFHRLHDLC